MPEPVKDFHFALPNSWHRELKAAAAAQHLSMGDLVRILVRDFLRGRYEAPPLQVRDAEVRVPGELRP